jgi:hypothetical protein
MPKPKCIDGCGQRAHHLHHVVYRQHLRRHGGDVKDPRNLVPMAFDCHGAHHSGARRLRLAMLPDSVYEFATELMGAGLAYETLGRYYGGDDPRLDALLSSPGETMG